VTPPAAPGADLEGLLRELTPQVVGIVARRPGDFAGAEDAAQEALVAAATQWPVEGRPDQPLAWLVRVASRRMTDGYRSERARRRREDLVAPRSAAQLDPAPAQDDTLVVMLMCCHPSLTPSAAIPLTLRAVAGLTTREIAEAFLVPGATMAQRISRAKAKIKQSDEPFALPVAAERDVRLRSVLHVLYLLYNEGYVGSSGPELARTDLSGEAIRLARGLHRALPDEPEVSGLLALMLLNEARRPARTTGAGELVPLAEQDRSRWDRALVAEGVALITDALLRGQVGEYQLEASIAAVHDQAPRFEVTNWSEIGALYRLLERMTGNPMVTLNRAVAVAMVDGPDAGLALLDGLDGRLGDHHRLHSVRAHLLERAGRGEAAAAEFRMAASRTNNVRERDYLTMRAAALNAGP
jgi:RNA polymerase sigma factor (sigma-70 family)